MTVLKGVVETLNPKGGNGLTESLVILVIVLSVIYMNIKGIEVEPMLINSFVLIIGWLFGRNTNEKKGDNDVN
jgi:hypothetical protein